MNDKTLKILKAARDIVASGWARGAAARDAYGNSVKLTDPDACSFCAFGAIAKAISTGSGSSESCIERSMSATQEVEHQILMEFDSDPSRQLSPIPWFNDRIAKRQADVVGLFSRTIYRIERKTHERQD